jgi:hypothetical protein
MYQCTDCHMEDYEITNKTRNAFFWEDVFTFLTLSKEFVIQI